MCETWCVQGLSNSYVLHVASSAVERLNIKHRSPTFIRVTRREEEEEEEEEKDEEKEEEEEMSSLIESGVEEPSVLACAGATQRT